MKAIYKGLMEKLISVLKKRYRDRFVSLVVYGSVARGDERRDSDIDLLLVIEDLPASRLKRQMEFMEVERELEDELNKLEARISIDFSPIIKTPQEAKRISSLYLDMVEDAVILYDKDNFFNEILEGIRERLKELGAKRVRMGKGWYWILKPDYRFGEVIEIE